MAAYRCQIRATLFGQQVYNTLSWRTTAVTAPSPAEAVAVAEDLAVNWDATVMDVLSQDYQLLGVDAVAVNDPSVGAFYGLLGDGNETEPAAPAFVTARMRLGTGLRGRAFQGHTGISGITELAIENNELTTAARTALQAAVTALGTAMISETEQWRPIVVSTIFNGAPRPFPLVTDVISFTVQVPLGSQVGRKSR